MKMPRIPDLLDSYTLNQFEFITVCMDHPWLLRWGISHRDEACTPSVFHRLLNEYIGQAICDREYNYREMILRRAFNDREYPNGLLGTENVAAIATALSASPHAQATLVVGLTGVHFHLQRCNDVLALKCCDAHNSLHLAAEADMEALAKRHIVTPFVHAYEFGQPLPETVDLPLLLNEVVDAVQGVRDARYHDAIPNLVAGYCGDREQWVPITSAYNVTIEATLGYRRDQKLCSAEVRRGMLERNDETGIIFRRSGSSGESGYLQLRVRTRSDRLIWRTEDVAMDVDHYGEQNALDEIALQIGLWMYHVARKRVLELNPHMHIHRVSKKVA